MRQLLKWGKSSVSFLGMLLVSGGWNLSGCEHRAATALVWELMKSQSCNLTESKSPSQDLSNTPATPLWGILLYHFPFGCFCTLFISFFNPEVTDFWHCSSSSLEYAGLWAFQWNLMSCQCVLTSTQSKSRVFVAIEKFPVLLSGSTHNKAETLTNANTKIDISRCQGVRWNGELGYYHEICVYSCCNVLCLQRAFAVAISAAELCTALCSCSSPDPGFLEQGDQWSQWQHIWAFLSSAS